MSGLSPSYIPAAGWRYDFVRIVAGDTFLSTVESNVWYDSVAGHLEISYILHLSRTFFAATDFFMLYPCDFIS